MSASKKSKRRVTRNDLTQNNTLILIKSNKNYFKISRKKTEVKNAAKFHFFLKILKIFVTFKKENNEKIKSAIS